MLVLLLSSVMLFSCDTSKTIAVVNGSKVKQSQLDRLVGQWEKSNPDQQITDSTKGAFYEQLISNELLIQFAKDKDVTITDEEVNTALDNFYKQSGMSKEDALAKYAEYGYNEQDIKDVLKRSLVQDAVSKKIAEDIKVTDEEVKALFDADPAKYKTVAGSHILFLVEEGATEIDDQVALSKANEVIAALNAGGDFKALATEKSEDTGSAANGGSLGEGTTRANSPFVTEFTDALFALEEGAFSQAPVKSQFGYHVIKADKVVSDFESLKESIKADLVNTRTSEEFQKQFKAFTDAAKIERKLTFSKEEPSTTPETK